MIIDIKHVIEMRQYL